ncbi:MAG TPA: hypothetical protein VFH37_01715 [Candidatus Saccharimonadales bacterium]|nr:hypothetical protein [Candidatus Saccharimonadales bacterium]
MKKEYLERYAYLHSEGQYYDDLAELEAERIVLTSLAELKIAQGFEYAKPSVTPVMPIDREGFLPPDSATIEERWEIALHSGIEAAALEKQYGKDNVWIGPQVSDEPVFANLTESEQRGLWVRDIDKVLAEYLTS